ncbi:MAG: ATP-binding protein [Pseudomonadota bacterium]
MIHNIVKEIKQGISKHFPGNFFLVNQSGILVEVDENMLQLSGVSDFKEIEGTHVRRFGEKAWETTLKVIKTRKREELYEKKGGKTYYVMKIPYTKGSFRGVLGFSIDITKLEQAKQTKTEFIMNMNHDIRTPFSGIVSVFEILADGERDPKKKEWIKIGLLSSLRLLSFMSDISQLSQLGHLPLDYETFDVTQVADDVLLFLDATVKSRGLDLIKTYHGNMVCSNPFRIKHILLNLLGNAIKFTEKGGISLSIKAASNLVITVQDSGIGIDKEYHEKIFEECFKATPSYKNSDYAGVGKGLYLVKNYVKDLQGKITVQSAANEGSTFIVEIPLRIGNSP